MPETPTDVKTPDNTGLDGQTSATPSNEATPTGADVGADVNAQGSEGAGEKRLVEKERLDALLEDRKARESLEREVAALKTDNAARLEAIANAASGNKQTPDKFAEFASEWNTDAKFINGLRDLLKDEITQDVDQKLQPVRSQAAQSAFTQQMGQLSNEFPEVSDLSGTEMEEFKAMAVDPKYRNTPLADVWKIRNYGKPVGVRKAAESSRGGTGTPSDGAPDISGMSVEAFEEYSNNLAKNQKR